MMDWDLYREPDGRIDVAHAFMDFTAGEVMPAYMNAVTYIKRVQEFQAIKSREAAAIVLATAVEVARQP